MSFYFVKTPKLIQSFYKNYIWKIDTNKKEIYLTFDDGPTPIVTEFVLNTLKKHQAKATFFCIGKNVQENPELFKRILNENHTIGNHTQNHLNGWTTSVNEYIKNIEEAENCILQNLLLNKKGIQQKLFRPPYGKIKKRQAKIILKNDCKIIMWSVLSGDFDTTIKQQQCLQNVLQNVESGSIVVFHDSEKAYNKLKNVLPKMLTHFLSLGFKFKAI